MAAAVPGPALSEAEFRAFLAELRRAALQVVGVLDRYLGK